MRVSADTDDGAGVGLDTLLADLIADIPARSAMLYTPDVPFDSPAGIWRTVGLPDETLRDYMANFKDLDPWADAATTAVAPSTGAVLNTDTMLDPHGLAGAPVHGDYLRRYGIARCLVAVVEDGRSGTMPRTRLSLIRGPSEPQFTPAEAERLGQLMRGDAVVHPAVEVPRRAGARRHAAAIHPRSGPDAADAGGRRAAPESARERGHPRGRRGGARERR